MTNKTYAQALAESAISFNAIRNIEIQGETEEAKAAIVAQLKKDEAMASFAIEQIKQKGPAQFVFKCADDVTAEKVQEQLQTKYHNALKISMAQRKRPQVKVIRLNTNTTDALEIKQQFVQQNAILTDENFEVTSVYRVVTPRGSYVNAILQSELELHNKLVEKRTLIFGFAEARVFEHVETLQCNKCLSYGHLAGSCKGAAHCRRCGGDHLLAECPTPDVIACFNCANANKRGMKYNVKHSPTDARCPVRRERVAGLK